MQPFQPLKKEIEDLKAQLNAYRTALANGVTIKPAPKVEAPNPEYFKGRGLQELDDFLRGLVQYFALSVLLKTEISYGLKHCV